MEKEKAIRYTQIKETISDMMDLYASGEINANQLDKILENLLPKLKTNYSLPF